MEQTCLSFNYRMILFRPLWLSLVLLVFLPLCRAVLPRRSARCQHPKCLQFERETAVIVLFSPLQICVSVLVQLTIVFYFVACALQLQQAGDVVGEVGVAGRWSLSPITWTSRTYCACMLHPRCIFMCMHKWWRINICWLPRECKSKDLTGIESVANMWEDPDLFLWQRYLTVNLCLKGCLFPWCHHLLF